MSTSTAGLSGDSPYIEPPDPSDPPRLVASDIGGTLVRGVKPVPPFTVRVLNRLMETGVPVVLVTGYNYNTTLRFAAGLDPKVLLMPQNGGLCIKEKEIVWEYRIPEPEVRALYDYFEKNKLPVIIYKGRNEDFGNFYISHREEPLSYGFQRIDRLQSFENITGISTLLPDESALKAKTVIETIVGDKFKVIYSRVSRGSWLEVVHSEVRKDFALKRLCEEMDIPPSKTIYFGDNFNDLEALRLVGHPVLVRNAADELKDEFTTFAGPVDDEGVAHYLNTLYGLNLL